jgi:hypothetical protein
MREFYHGDRRVSHYRETGELLPDTEYVFPAFDVPTFPVSTLDGYSPDLEFIKDQIFYKKIC